jgi:hypothetical protein
MSAGLGVVQEDSMRSVACIGVLSLALAAGWSTLERTALAAQTPAAGATVPTGEVALGTVTIGRSVTADGKPLPSGTYQLRLTAQQASPPAAGQTADYERWVEFRRGNMVVGREVVSIVPGSEIGEVAGGAPPGPGGTRVELLKGNDYLRIWLNRGGIHYLVHLPTGLTAS